MRDSEDQSGSASDPAFAIEERPFHGNIDAAFLSRLQLGVLRTLYRGVPCLKSPFDLVLYLQLINRLRPRTIIEIGTKFGGSALWFADTQLTHGIQGRVVSVDKTPPDTILDERIDFLQGDVRMLAECLAPSYLGSLEHPWLVVEDSAHYFETTLAALDFFDHELISGDYIVIEDGVVDQLPEPNYRVYRNGPNRAVADFVARHRNDYVIDTSLCDQFGYNVTYCPNGWLRRL
jgi:cephalosporin hydroxylase